MSKAEQIKNVLEALDPNFTLQIEDRPDGSTWLIGPYPSFVIMLNVPTDDGKVSDGYIVSVNADAPNVTYFLQHTFSILPGMIHFGPYCEDEENQTILGGPQAYEMKEDIILKTAAVIFARRKAEKEATPKIIVPEQKIIVTGNQ